MSENEKPDEQMRQRVLIRLGKRPATLAVLQREMAADDSPEAWRVVGRAVSHLTQERLVHYPDRRGGAYRLVSAAEVAEREADERREADRERLIARCAERGVKVRAGYRDDEVSIGMADLAALLGRVKGD